MEKLKVGDWIYWSSVEKMKKYEEPEQVVSLKKMRITERKRPLETYLITTDRGSSAYIHSTYFRIATEEKSNEMKLKKMFEVKPKKNPGSDMTFFYGMLENARSINLKNRKGNSI